MYVCKRRYLIDGHGKGKGTAAPFTYRIEGISIRVGGCSAAVGDWTLRLEGLGPGTGLLGR